MQFTFCMDAIGITLILLICSNHRRAQSVCHRPRPQPRVPLRRYWVGPPSGRASTDSRDGWRDEEWGTHRPDRPKTGDQLRMRLPPALLRWARVRRETRLLNVVIRMCIEPRRARERTGPRRLQRKTSSTWLLLAGQSGRQAADVDRCLRLGSSTACPLR